MYSDIINTFLNSIRSLRYYVDSVENNVDIRLNSSSDTISGLAHTMHAVISAKKKGINLDEFDFSEIELEKIRENSLEDIPKEEFEKAQNLIKEMISSMNRMIKEKVIDNKIVYEYIWMPKELKEKYREVEMRERQADILYSGALMLLVTYFENLISGILKKDFVKHPERIALNEKSVSYKQLIDYGDIEGIKEYLIDQEVTNMMYGSLADWKNFFEKKIKLSISFWGRNFNTMQEIMARRNLFVHNNGIINTIYLNLIQNKTDTNRLGDSIEINREYIDKAINILEYAGVTLAIEAWLKEYGNNNDEIQNITGFIFEEYLIAERWNVARDLYEICLQCNKLCTADELMCQINKWQCYKWLGEFEQIKLEIEGVDVSASQPKYQLGILALQERYKEFFECFDRQDDIGEAELKEWPLFMELRQSNEFIERFSKITDNDEADKV